MKRYLDSFKKTYTTVMVMNQQLINGVYLIQSSDDELSRNFSIYLSQDISNQNRSVSYCAYKLTIGEVISTMLSQVSSNTVSIHDILFKNVDIEDIIQNIEYQLPKLWSPCLYESNHNNPLKPLMPESIVVVDSLNYLKIIEAGKIALCDVIKNQRNSVNSTVFIACSKNDIIEYPVDGVINLYKNTFNTQTQDWEVTISMTSHRYTVYSSHYVYNPTYKGFKFQEVITV